MQKSLQARITTIGISYFYRVSWRRLLAVIAAMAPSPTAETTCLGELLLISPTANTWGILVCIFPSTIICPESSRGIIPSRYSVFGSRPTCTRTPSTLTLSFFAVAISSHSISSTLSVPLMASTFTPQRISIFGLDKTLSRRTAVAVSSGNASITMTFEAIFAI